jgi:murein DD-endopeptidase MepM/ murein hydrolase activator NlpD
LLIIEGMKVLLARRLPLAFLVAGALTAGSAGASSPAQKPQAVARAYSIKIVIPGQAGGGTPSVAAPPDAVALGGTFSYPADGSVVSTGSLSASASTDVGIKTADARGTSEVASLQLFGGELAATRLFVRATANAGPTAGSGSPDGAVISGLTILGQPTPITPNTRVPLADWGSAVVLEQGVDATAPAGRKGARTTVAALDVQLTQAHGVLPAGSQILVAYAEASAQANATPPPPPPPPTTTGGAPGTTAPAGGGGKPAPTGGAKTTRRPQEPHPSPFGTSPLQVVPHHGRPKLTAGPYVFPVFGPVSFTDTYGAPRADVGWHHGDDIFAPLGAPVLAVAKGVVFSVGWNDLGGNRLWLKDGQGNEYYYAHLSAYSPLAVNGGRVNAGDVLGFVGNTGDAISTPTHLHFEIHPVSLLGKGYDGAVDPTPYLTAWQHLRALTFSAGATPGRTAVSGTVRSTAPEPGAILLQVSDISSAAGLDPAAIKRALATGRDIASNEGVAALLGLANRG